MGVKLALSDRQVVAYCGDGALMYYPQALWTAAQQNIAVVVVVMNNGGYESLRQLLAQYQGESFKQLRMFTGTQVTGIDYVRMAESWGVEGIRVQAEAELVRALKRALTAGRPMLVEVLLDQDNDLLSRR